jgi:phage-related protein
MELRLGGRALDQQGWLRAIFYVYDVSHTIFIVDLFWKKTHKISKADRIRRGDRIRRLKSQLKAGGHP